MNKFAFTGRVMDVPVYKTSQKGTGLCSFKVGVRRDYKNKETGKYDNDYFMINTFGSTADYCARNVDKNCIVYVEGKVSNNSYTDKNGIKRYTDNYIANIIEVPYGRDAALKLANYNNAQAATAADENYHGQPDPEQLQQAAGNNDGFVEVDDSDLPF